MTQNASYHIWACSQCLRPRPLQPLIGWLGTVATCGHWLRENSRGIPQTWLAIRIAQIIYKGTEFSVFILCSDEEWPHSETRVSKNSKANPLDHTQYSVYLNLKRDGQQCNFRGSPGVENSLGDNKIQLKQYWNTQFVCEQWEKPSFGTINYAPTSKIVSQNLAYVVEQYT